MKQASYALLVLLIAFVTTVEAKTVTETRTFRGGSAGIFYKKSDACQQSLKKYEQQRINKACTRVKGKLKIDHVDCDCSQNNVEQWHCKKMITATCTYDSNDMKPAQGFKNVFGIKKKPDNNITQTQVLKVRGKLNNHKSCRMQKTIAVSNARHGCSNVAGKVKLLKFDCECETVATRLYDCIGVLTARCTFDKGKIKAYKELDPELARSRYGFGILEDMLND